ncbi:MAG: 4-hydroxy-3-methylbut-2-enyl diphosphate reductase [Candidatus Electrothrix sp. AX5]|jgi:4-hydroxy-3-methylbut-2-enyl diphosphate reductase|uniref:4-hydroxy-3-methylbut-2-enyl diphosphate reductase n=1 Tax=Candidatus Electrothrix aarhusensis TaxID=1859131 RepID=A0A444IV59_9BACT|nr:4-hydroxy-3-methylbut-2-enyl diphosphate reductase [Candidatus Electrothrix sp. AX5]RWX44761.1 4-hydroxy-3-methylbut-2-enyl diphosphate reductase [Candidatus Electrothrix aarhusensis]
MEVILARPRGFCAGVNRAINVVNKALEVYKPPVYVLHEIVHNTHVIRELEEKGAVFVEQLEDIPKGSIAIFSAHGVSKAVKERANNLGLRTINATCPLVSKVHRRVSRLNKINYDVVVIGHKGHPEVEGTCGHASGSVHVVSSPEEVQSLQVNNPSRVGYVTQTTLSIDDTAKMLTALRKQFPNISEPSRTDICFATSNRQAAVRELSESVDLILVVGSKNSSNSNRLREVAQKNHIPAYLIDHAEEIDGEWLNNAQRIGITAGASAPEYLVTELVAWLRENYGIKKVQEMDGTDETICFQLPAI